MGLFDFITGGSPENQIKKHAKKVRNKDTPVEDRQASALWLAKNGTPQAILGLLGRFEMNYEHSMKDTSEKEEVANLVLGLGARAEEPLRTFITRSQQFARALTCYEQLLGQEKAVSLVLSLLDDEYERGELKPDKKRNLLIKAGDYRDPRIAANVSRFLTDFDEGVRYAAAEVLIGQDETPEVREALLDRLADPKEESNRLRVRVSEVVLARAWEPGERLEALAANPPPGFRVRDGALVRG